MSDNIQVTKVQNKMGATIEVGFIVTVVEQEHVYGTGEVYRIAGRIGEPFFALVRWEQAVEPRYQWLEVDELTNINVAQRDRTLRA